MSRRAVSLALMLTSLATVGAAHAEDASGLRASIERLATDAEALHRFYDVRTSDVRRERLRRFYREQSERLADTDFAALDADGRIDYHLLANFLDHELRDLDSDGARGQEIAEWLPFAADLVALEEARWRMDTVEPQAAAERLADAIESVEATREDIAARESPSRVLARRAAAGVDTTREALATWFGYHDGFKPDFSWWVKRPHERLDAALEGYAKFLREEIAGIVEGEEEPLIGDPIGRDDLLAGLDREMIPYTPEELIAIAEEELAWCEREMLAAAAEMGLGDDWRAALEAVKERHAPPGEQDALVKRQSDEIIAYLIDRDLLTLPPLAAELWRLEMIPPADQKFWPFAYYGGLHMAQAYAASEMEHRAKREAMRGNNIHFSRNVTPHELIPGHHLQIFMADRHRPYRKLFRTPFLTEGWALYWEMQLYDWGYPRGPEDRVGMLFWRMHRCARIIISLRFHLDDMEPEEMVEFLVERIGHERDNATAEVRRYIAGGYGPLYQCAYMLGGLQLRALYRERVDGGAMTAKEFHDAVLRQGAIPIELIRAALSGTMLEKDFVSSWRFADS